MPKRLEDVLSVLRLIAKKFESSAVSDPEFKDTLERAQVSAETDVAATAPVMSALLTVFYMKKPRLIEKVLPVLQRLIHTSCIPYGTYMMLYQQNGEKQALNCGDAMFVALSDFLTPASDSASRLKGVEILNDLVNDDNFPGFSGKCVTRCVRICYQLTLTSSLDGVRSLSRDLLFLCILRVTRSFVLDAPPAPDDSPRAFASSTELDDYVHDVEPDAKFTRVEFNGLSFDQLDASAVRGNGTTATPLRHSSECPLEAPLHVPTYASDDRTLSSGSYRTGDFFCSSHSGSIMRSALAALGRGGQMPTALKDMVLLVKYTCRLATRAVSGSGSTSEGNPEIRSRQLALEMLDALLAELPQANCNAEHQCAFWLSLLLSATRYDLLRCVAKNLATVTPQSFYSLAVSILTHLMRKCHYHMASELHALLATMLFPLTHSQFSSFSQKHAVLSMVRELLCIPHLCVSYFINYDCNPDFDPSAKHGGMLELLVDFVLDMFCAYFVDPDWLSLDQQQLLRGECVGCFHSLLESMQRWAAEDPIEYEQKQAREAAVLAMNANRTRPLCQWQQVYRDVWESNSECENMSAMRDNLSEEMSFDTAPRGASGLEPDVDWRRSPGYHWKHIHCLLRHKRIVQEALQLVHKGQWREAKALLERLEFIPSGDSGWHAFAAFLRRYADRSALCGIFERVLRDADCDKLLTEYMQLFNYRSVPIDIALRDTTCEFMSWDRPSFEAQIWGVIQQRFGEAYSAQNAHSITPRDANAMSGVLLFLHTSLHNDNARNCRMTEQDFVRNGNECVEYPFPEEEMRAMYHRIAQRKWELDEMQRTPRHAEMELGSARAPLTDNSLQRRGSACTSAQKPIGTGVNDSTLLESSVLPYAEETEGFRIREAFIDVATEHLRQLEREHRQLHLRRAERPVMPYAVPRYAQHVRPMLLTLYPQIAAALYMGFRVLDEQPIFRQLLDTYQLLYDVAAVFVVNLGGMRVAVERRIQECLRYEGAQQLPMPIRVTFALPLMNLL